MNISDVSAIKKLKELELDPDGFAVFGSGPMFANGIIDWDVLKDLDCLVTGIETWEFLLSVGEATYNEKWDCETISLEGGLLEFWNGWGPEEYDIESMVDESDIFDGIRFVKLAEVVKWKLAMGREKDKEHVKLIYDKFPDLK